ncbi:MAG TPA: hybrid sensor histidine kinase/response regulator [Holophagaceae bacterium]|nr:hybrid sensor histidine kinase/response regulator [Holophagaceae bacterium]
MDSRPPNHIHPIRSPESLGPALEVPRPRAPHFPGHVLVVDDNEANRALLEGLFEFAGYQVTLASSGEEALERALASPPDAVLMDIQMPGMGGFNACRAFAAEGALGGIPILFISAHSNAQEKVLAFEIGGKDYITKPFQAAEVVARVAHHIRAAQLEALLTRRNVELEEAASRIQELDHAKASITAMLVHDLRSPLQAVTLSIDTVASGLSPFANMLPRINEALGRIDKLVTEMLELSRAQSAEFSLNLQPVDLEHPVEEVLRVAESQAKAARVSLLADLPESIPLVNADISKLDRALLNLIGNALKYTPPGGTVHFAIDTLEGEGVDQGLRWLRFTVTDSGPGIPPDLLPFIFDPFRQVQNTSAAQGVGLGLSIVKRIVAAHHGRIQSQSQVGVGTTFRVLLPIPES